MNNRQSKLMKDKFREKRKKKRETTEKKTKKS